MALRLGVIGCGNVSLNRHLPAAREVPGAVEIVAAADPTLSQLERFRAAAGLGADDGSADYRALLARSDIEAVLVATPPAFRPPIVWEALAAGKHVLSEKPLALVPAEAWRLARAARAAGRWLGMVHNYYFQPAYARVKQVLERGTIGEPYLVTLNLLGVEDRPGSAAYQPRWRHDPRSSGGGVLMDMLHAVYLPGWLLGQRPCAVSAAVDRRLGGDDPVEDVALCRFELERGFALVNVAWGEGPGGVEIMGTEGRLLLFFQGYGTGPFVPPEQLHVFRGAERVPVDFVPDPSRGFGGTLRDFALAVAEGRAPIAPGEQGCETLEGVLGAYASAVLERQVALPLDPAGQVYQHGLAGLAQLRAPAGSRVARRGLFGLAAGG